MQLKPLLLLSATAGLVLAAALTATLATRPDLAWRKSLAGIAPTLSRDRLHTVPHLPFGHDGDSHAPQLAVVMPGVAVPAKP